MKYTILLFALLFWKTSLFGQELKVQGHLIDENKRDLVAATIRCYMNDTLFMIGGSTNSKGEFELKLPRTEQKYKLLISYLGYKETTLVLNPTKETLIRLGEITMDKKVVQIQEVTVLAQNRINTEDKIMVFPTREQLRHSYDGYSTLFALMIPGLEADPRKATISYHNENVLLCIDGREATQEEVQNLNPKDIKRVDFYSQGSSDYPEASTMLDYILKERDYLGTIAFNARHQLNRPTGNGRGTAQYFEGKSEWAVSVSDNYTHSTNHDEGYIETLYHFPEETIIRTDDKLPSLVNNNNLKTYLNYIYKDKLQTFYSSLRMNRSMSENDSWNRQRYNNTSTVLVKQENTYAVRLNPALQLRYNRTLPKRQKLRLELYGSYGNNDYDRWYEQRTDEVVTSSYANATAEDSWYGKLKFDYNKSFKNKSSFSLVVNQDFTHTNNLNTKEGIDSEIFLNNSNTYLYGTYNYRIMKKLNLQVGLAEHLSYTTTNGSHVFNSFFIPSLKLSYLYKGHSLRLTGTVRSIETGISNRTGYEYKRNEYEMYVGNPKLEDYLQYNMKLDYTWTVNSRWTILSYATLYASNRQVYGLYSYNDERKMFVYQNFNGGKCFVQHYKLGMQYEFIPQVFSIKPLLIYDNAKVTLWKELVNHSLWGACSLLYMRNGWRFNIGYMAPANFMNYDSGLKGHFPGKLEFGVNYSINNWNVDLHMQTPYKAVSKGHLQQIVYDRRSESRTPRVSDHVISLSLNYRFTFGKKKHKFDNSVIEDTNQSTISRD